MVKLSQPWGRPVLLHLRAVSRSAQQKLGRLARPGLGDADCLSAREKHTFSLRRSAVPLESKVHITTQFSCRCSWRKGKSSEAIRPQPLVNACGADPRTLDCQEEPDLELAQNINCFVRKSTVSMCNLMCTDVLILFYICSCAIA